MVAKKLEIIVTADSAKQAAADMKRFENSVRGVKENVDAVDDAIQFGLRPEIGRLGTLLSSTVSPQLLAVAAAAGAVAVGAKAIQSAIASSTAAQNELKAIGGDLKALGGYIARSFEPLVRAGLGAMRPIIIELSNAARPILRELTIGFQRLGQAMSTPEMRDSIRELARQVGAFVTGIKGDDISRFVRGMKQFAELMQRYGPPMIQGISQIVEVLGKFAAIIDRVLNAGRALAQSGVMQALGGGRGIPGFQHGGFLPSGGVGIVGEAGPEYIMSGPGGTMVAPMTTNYNFYAPMSFTAPSGGDLFGLFDQARRAAGG